MARKFNASETVEIGRNTISVCQSQNLMPAKYFTLKVCTDCKFKFLKIQLKLSSSENKFCEFWKTFLGETKKNKPADKPFVTNTLIPMHCVAVYSYCPTNNSCDICTLESRLPCNYVIHLLAYCKG